MILLLAPPANAGPDPKPEGAPATPAAPAEPSSTEAEEAVLAGLTQIDAGYDLSCGRTTTGQVRCWGENDIGQLGQGDRNPRTFAVTVKNAAGNGPLTGVVQVAVGDDHACALLTSGEVRCWGDNSDFELGSGFISNDKTRPVPVVGLNGTGRLRNVVAIGAESDGACALLSNREVRCWGADDFGQLGNGNPLTDSNKPVVVKGTGGTGRLGNVTQIDPGFDNACARLANGQARCWGYNDEGELGNNTTTGSPFPVVVKNLAGGGPLTGVTQVSIGGYVGCARLANGQARCWGDNAEGSVGAGTTTNRYRPPDRRRGDLHRQRPRLRPGQRRPGPLLGLDRQRPGRRRHRAQWSRPPPAPGRAQPRQQRQPDRHRPAAHQPGPHLRHRRRRPGPLLG